MSAPDERASEIIVTLLARAMEGHYDEAVGWVVLIRDDETGVTDAHGPFDPGDDGLMEAHAWVTRIRGELHSGLPPGEPGWSLDVVPLLPSRHT